MSETANTPEASEVEPLLTEREKAIHMAAYEKGARDTIAAMRPAVVDEDKLKREIIEIIFSAATSNAKTELEWADDILNAIHPYLRDTKQESGNE